MRLEIIRDKNRWIDALDEIKKFDPCHRYSFHNAYKYHMDAKDLLIIRIQQGEKLILYPMIISDSRYFSRRDLFICYFSLWIH